MKFLFLGLVALPLFASTLGKIDESVFIKGHNKELIKLINNQPHLTLDHVNSDGFELYGPVGTKKWLNQVGVDFYSIARDDVQKARRKYPSFEDMTKFLKDITSKYPKISKLFSIGKSVEGRDLWVVKISDNVEEDEVEPEFKYISSMHGDEITGRELTQFFIKDILEGYGYNKEIKSLVNNTEIFIMPSMNPDGSNKKKRANANGYDLNRNFPNWTNNDPNSLLGRQPEVQAIMKFQKSRNFALSANFHGGAECVNYPWDSAHERHPLNDLLIDISLTYANENPAMKNSRYFDRGITNGADWYVLKGGMQDWSYIWHNDLQVTIELSNTKYPRYSKIPGFYKDNKVSMFEYLKVIHRGAGFKLGSKKNGTVKLFDLRSNKFMGEFDFKNGEFYKVLPVGEYKFVANSENTKNTFYRSVQKDQILTNGNYTK